MAGRNKQSPHPYLVLQRGMSMTHMYRSQSIFSVVSKRGFIASITISCAYGCINETGFVVNDRGRQPIRRGWHSNPHGRVVNCKRWFRYHRLPCFAIRRIPVKLSNSLPTF